MSLMVLPRVTCHHFQTSHVTLELVWDLFGILTLRSWFIDRVPKTKLKASFTQVLVISIIFFCSVHKASIWNIVKLFKHIVLNLFTVSSSQRLLWLRWGWEKVLIKRITIKFTDRFKEQMHA